jgi:NAD(P)H-dependent flavin oxidoreductase YrpB (nitropropane dioxygenase family)
VTRFTDLVGCRLPLQIAGMGWIAGPDLCCAVTDAGGLGMTALPQLPVPALEQVLSTIATRCDGPFGINFLVPFLHAASVEAASALAPVIEFFYGQPDRALIARARPAVVLWQVGSVEEARAAVDAGVDAVIAQGTEAGGHVRGHLSLLPLLDEILDAVSVPVVAAGGIATARAVAAVLAAGADAVRVGTAFLAAEEADIHHDYQAAVLGAGGADTVLTTAFATGWPDAPHRVLRSALDRATSLDNDSVGTIDLGGNRFPVPRLGVHAATRSFDGDTAATALYAGEGVGAVHHVRPAADIVAELMAGAALAPHAI